MTTTGARRNRDAAAQVAIALTAGEVVTIVRGLSTPTRILEALVALVVWNLLVLAAAKWIFRRGISIPSIASRAGLFVLGVFLAAAVAGIVGLVGIVTLAQS